MWPISASMALRRRRSAISLGVRPRRVPLIRTRVRVSPCPRYPRVDDGEVGALVGQDGDLFQRGAQGVAVIGVARKTAHADDKALVQRGGDAD
jgi:hypothetical protein